MNTLIPARRLVQIGGITLLFALTLSPLAPPRTALPRRAQSDSGVVQASTLAQARGVAGGEVSVAAADILLDKGDGSTPAPASEVAIPPTVTTASFLVPTTKSSLPFTDIAPHFSGSVPADTKVEIDLRFSEDGQNWGDWIAANAATISNPERDKAGEVYGSLISVPQSAAADGSITPPRTALYAEARLKLSSSTAGKTPHLSQFSFAFIDGGQSAGAPLATIDPAMPGSPAIVRRSGWGATATTANWPPVYTPATHIIIHHTGTTNASSDWAASVRSIWYYQSQVRGWGDIGYNYLIDPAGNIYEGRAGGADVAGSHSYPFDYGTVGIALLGEYSVTDPPAPMLDSLTKLSAWLVHQRGIDPLGKSEISGKLVCGKTVIAGTYNITGGRDYAGVGCDQPFNSSVSPGDRVVAALPDLRNGVEAALPQYNAIFLNHDAPTTMSTGATYNINLSVRNGGKLVWPANGDNRVRLGYRWFDAGGKLLDLQDMRTSLPHDVPFGGTVNLYAQVIAPSAAGNYTLTLDLVHEGVTWFYEQQTSTPLQVPVKVGVGDSTPPLSRISVLPLYQTQSGFIVSWSGSDEGGSGIASYDVQYKLPPYGEWQNLLNATTNTKVAFQGTNGFTYYFRVRARDKVGNLEQFRDAPDAQTTVDTVPPGITISSPRPKEHVPTGVVTFTGTTERGALVLVNDVPAIVQGESYTATLQTSAAGRNFLVTARAWDYAGNTASSVVISYLESNFSDLPISGTLREAIIFVGDRGYLDGYSDNSFRPDQPFSRGDAAKAGVLAAAWPTATTALTQSSFSDVPTDYPTAAYIQTAIAHGAIGPDLVNSSTFKPKDGISRYDMVKLLAVAGGWTLANPTTAHFSDVSNSSPYYKYVETAIAQGVLPDRYKSTSFNGDTPVTRGEAAWMLYRAFGNK